MTPSTPHRLLTRHFLRRFLENDLVSPEADRSQFVALVGASCFCTSVFITVAGSCFRYAMGHHTAGQAAVASLDDKVFFFGLSMIGLALLAASQWDALSVEARDAAILEPLPVAPSTVRRAKLAAVAILGAGACALINAAPSVFFPLVLVINQRVRVIDVFTLMLVHALVASAAAAFGYLSIVALREVCALAIGPRLLARVTPLLQGMLIIVLGSGLLLMPAASSGVEARLREGSGAWSPVLWFLGAHEVIAGHILMDGPRGALTPRLREADRLATSRYRAREAQFADLAQQAAVGAIAIAALAAVGYVVNSRRFPHLAPPSPTPSYRRSRWQAWARRLVTGRDPAVAAGFDFALAVMWRSRPHRLLFACALAVALAAIVVVLSGLDVGAAAAGRGRVRLLIAQPILYGMLLVVFRQAIRVPAELPANWGFQVSWRGQTGRYLTGARRAAVVSLVCPAVAIVVPLVAVVLGPSLALIHAVMGIAGALLLLEVLLFTYEKVPFTCTLVPDESLKAFGPIYVVAFVVGAVSFARLQSAALESPGESARLVAALLALVASCRLARLWRPRGGRVEFDQVPTASTQRLGLDG